MYYAVSLEDVKKWLNITGTSHDEILNKLRLAATTLAERYCGKVLITRRFIEDITVDKPYTSTIVVQNYPVYINPAGDNFKVYNDPDRQFGADTLINPDDYVLEKEIGRVQKVSGYFLRGVKAVRVDYWAGYSRFEVLDNVNDKLQIVEGSTAYTADVAAGTYIAEDLASAIQTAISGAGVTNTYTVSYDHLTQKFTISSSGTFELKVNIDQSIGGLIGFTSDKSGKSSYSSDSPQTGLPGDLQVAVKMIIHRWWRLSKQGEGGLDLTREIMNEAGTREYDRTWIPLPALMTLEQYRRVFG